LSEKNFHDRILKWQCRKTTDKTHPTISQQVCDDPHTLDFNMTLPAADIDRKPVRGAGISGSIAAARARAAANRSCTSLLSIDGTDRQTDGRTDTVP